MTPQSKPAALAAATVDFPSEGELIFSPHYAIRVTAPDAAGVEVSVDAGEWKSARLGDGFWWYDWSGYGPGAHMVCARIQRKDGSTETLRPRALRVALQPQGNPGMQHVNGAESSNIHRGLSLLRNLQVQFVQLWFTDVAGKPWRICLPVDHITEEAFTAGITLDGPSTSTSFLSYINLLPDPGAIFKDPLATIPTAAIVCDLLEPPDSGVAGLGVRQVLRSAVDSLGTIEPGLTATIGAEPEFFLLERDGKTVVKEEVLWDFVCDLCKVLTDAGIRSEGFRFGPAPGQGRVQMKWTDPVRTADQVILYRWWAKVLADRRGKVLTFEPAPASGVGAASMPVHHSLWLGPDNAFHDAKGWQQTSDLCRWYAGGIIEHAAAVTALAAPTTASYPAKAGSQAARIKPFLSQSSPNAICRVPERQLTARGRRIKFRAGNANANPYLTLAATILAGVDGIKKQLDPAIDQSDKSLPGSIGEALKGLDKDRDFLRAGGFGDKLIDAWIEGRRRSPDQPAIDAY